MPFSRSGSKRFFPIIILAFLLLAACFLFFTQKEVAGLGEESVVDPPPLSWTAPDYVEPVRSALVKAKGESMGATQVAVTSHHLPTAASFIAKLYRLLEASDGPRQTFVIIGPDHFERCATYASTTLHAYRTAFGTLEPDRDIIQALTNNGVGKDDACFEREHSIGAQAPFVASLFPQAKIVPITLSSATSEATVEAIAQTLARFQDRITIIASVDFSHYKSVDEARRIDDETEKMMLAGNVSALTIRSVDSPPSLRLALAVAKIFDQTKTRIIGRANSADFTGNTQNTTGYQNILFTQ